MIILAKILKYGYTHVRRAKKIKKCKKVTLPLSFQDGGGQ